MKRLLILAAGCIAIPTLMNFTGCKAQNDQQKTTDNKQPETTMEKQPETTESKTGRKVRIKTKFGDMVVLLYDETPAHRDNFIKLTKENFYDSLLFHRCIKGFMAQGGDPQSKNADPRTPLGSGGPGYTVPAEFNNNLIHKKGALAAARQGDQVNPEKRSSGSQFYLVQGRVQTDATLQQVMNYKKTGHPDMAYTPEQINLYKTIGGTPELDRDYTVFGEIVEGLDVLDMILSQPAGPQDRPVEPIRMDIDLIN